MPMTRKPIPERYCEACGKQLMPKVYGKRRERPSTLAKRRYCDQKCMAAGMMRADITPDAYRRRSSRMRGPNCENCGTAEHLEAHHKDGDYTNNSRENIMTLCAACHAAWHWRHGKTIPKTRTVCRICGAPEQARGLCDKHYRRMRDHGDPLMFRRKGGRVIRESDPREHAISAAGKQT